MFLIIKTGHPLSTYAKFAEKLTFLTPWYARIRVRIRGLEMFVLRKILHTYLMDGPLERFLRVMSQHLETNFKYVIWPITKQLNFSVSGIVSSMLNATSSNNNTQKSKDLKTLFNEYCSIPEQVKNEISVVSRWTTLFWKV